LALTPKPQVVPTPAPQLTVTVELEFWEPIEMLPPDPWVSWMPLPLVPPRMIVVDALAVEPIVTRLVPAPVGVPLAMLTVLPPATVVALVAMLIVSITVLPVPVLLPRLIVRAAAGSTLPRLMPVTRVLLPRFKVAIPAVPPPERMLTLVVAAVAALAMLIVSPKVDWPKVSELVLLVEPILTELTFVVPILIEPLVAACMDTAVPPLPPWIRVWVAAVVLPRLRVVAVAATVTLPFVVLAEPLSIETAPDAPLVESPDLIVSAPELLVPPVPVALPERNVIADDGVDAVLTSAV